jgi:hypothetical protein
MIVPAMTNKEIYCQLLEDYALLERRSYLQAGIFQQEMFRKKLRSEVRVITYKTAHHNEWNILFRISTDTIHKVFYLRTCDKIGTVSYHIEFTEGGEKHLVKHNTHFYQRYNERMKLNLSIPADVIKHFFKYNIDYDAGLSEVTENGQQLIEFVSFPAMSLDRGHCVKFNIVQDPSGLRNVPYGDVSRK